MQRLVVTILLILSAVSAMMAQHDAALAQYYEVPSYFNPSAIGSTDFVRIRAGARLQWLGIEGAPRSFIGLADSPFKIGTQRIAAGINVWQESIGLYKSLNIGAQVAYKLKKWGGMWSFGIQPGFYDQSFKGSEVRLPDDDEFHQGSDDAIPTTDIHGTAFDIAAGIWYEHPRFYAGVSCTHITSPTVALEAENAAGGSESSDRRYEFSAPRTLYFTAGCNIPVKNTLFDIAPSVLVMSDFTFTTAEITARARYRRMFSVGIGYRWNDAVIATLAAEIKNFYIGYSYEYATSAIHSASSGSHEVFVGYSLKLDLSDKNLNRHKSVRIM